MRGHKKKLLQYLKMLEQAEKMTSVGIIVGARVGDPDESVFSMLEQVVKEFRKSSSKSLQGVPER